MSTAQKNALAAWLKSTRERARNPLRPRFIVLPSPLVPFFSDAAGSVERGVRSDAWQRYPDCANWLLELIHADGTGNIVPLCGDYHLFADCVITLRSSLPPEDAVTCRCITTSGIYCPYGFANTSPGELLQTAGGQHGELHWQYIMNDVREGSGHVEIEASEHGHLCVKFMRTKG